MEDSIIYYPIATVIDKNGEEQKLITYDGVRSLEDCFNQFDIWENLYGYKIISACIQKIEFGVHVQVNYYRKQWIPIQ